MIGKLVIGLGIGLVSAGCVLMGIGIGFYISNKNKGGNK